MYGSRVRVTTRPYLPNSIRSEAGTRNKESKDLTMKPFVRSFGGKPSASRAALFHLDSVSARSSKSGTFSSPAHFRK
jgi:hypothetical protein